MFVDLATGEAEDLVTETIEISILSRVTYFISFSQMPKLAIALDDCLGAGEQEIGTVPAKFYLLLEFDMFTLEIFANFFF